MNDAGRTGGVSWLAVIRFGEPSAKRRVGYAKKELLGVAFSPHRHHDRPPIPRKPRVESVVQSNRRGRRLLRQTDSARNDPGIICLGARSARVRPKFNVPMTNDVLPLLPRREERAAVGCA